MDKQTVKFAVKKTDNTVNQIGRSYVSHPEIQFTGGSIKWHEDRSRQEHSNKNG